MLKKTTFKHVFHIFQLQGHHHGPPRKKERLLDEEEELMVPDPIPLGALKKLKKHSYFQIFRTFRMEIV